MSLFKQFDFLLKKATCPNTGHILNLKFDKELIYIPDVQGVIWGFRKKLTERTNLITELWNLQYNDRNLYLVIKYSPNSNTQFYSSIEHLNSLNKQLTGNRLQSLLPRVKYAERIDPDSKQSTITTIVMPYIDGCTLKDCTIDSLNNGTVTDKFDIAFSSCLKALKQLHSLPIPLMKNLTTPYEIAKKALSCENLEGRLFERTLLRIFLKKVRKKRLIDLLKEIEGINISYIHGDCFPYNLVIDDTNSVQLIDWESVQIGFKLQDLSQLFGSIVLAFITSKFRYDHLERLNKTVDKVYMKGLSQSIVFRIFLFKAIVRFSPLTRKYFVVVPLEIGKKVKYQKILQTKYPIIVANYYMFIWRFFKETLTLNQL